MSRPICTPAEARLWDGLTVADVEEASDRCMDCPLAIRCRAAAVAGREWGVWGGTYFEDGIPTVKATRPRQE